MPKNKIKYILISMGIVSVISIISVSVFFGVKSCSKSKESIESMPKKPIIEKNMPNTEKPQDPIKLAEEVENLRISSNNLEKSIEKSVEWIDYGSIKGLNDEAQKTIKNNKELISLPTKKIETVIKQISQTNSSIKKINDEILFIKSNDLKFLNKELKTELVSQKNKLIENKENKNVAIVKNEIQNLQDLVNNTETNIKNIETDTKNLINTRKNLITTSNSLDTALKKMHQNLEMFIKEFPNNVKFLNKNNVKKTQIGSWNSYADWQKKDQFEVNEKIKVDDLTYDYDVEYLIPHGILMFKLNIKYGKISETVLIQSNEKFVRLQEDVFRDFHWTFFKDSYSNLYISNWIGTAARKKTDLKKIIIKLEDILDKKSTPITDDNKDVLDDGVATFLWVYEYAKSNNKQESLEKIKREFINKKEDENFSKLEYLLHEGKDDDSVKWNEIFNFAMLVSFAHGTGKNDSIVNEFREPVFVDFMKKWFNDYITKYYSLTTKKVKNRKLYEIFQPKRTLDILIVLKNIIDKNQLFKAYEIVKSFSKSISKYYVTNDITNPNEDTKLVDSMLELVRLFSTRQFLALETYDGKMVYENAKDFKYWLENVDYEKLFGRYNGDSSYIRGALWWFRQMMLLIINMKKYNLELGLSDTNFEKLQNWVLKTLIADPKLATFENMNKIYGKTWMEDVAEIYLIMGINPKAQKEFVQKLKESPLIKNRKKSDFKNHSSMSFDTKDVWDLFFN